MKQNNLWILLFVVAIVCWSFYEMYPPTSRDLVQEFSSRAVSRDAAFSDILQRLGPLQQARPDREFANLQDAIGTNSLQPYFPFFNARNEIYPNTFILNQLQREALGKIKLGLDLQGGTSFLVKMDTNNLVYVETVTNSSGAVEQCRRYRDIDPAERASGQQALDERLGEQCLFRVVRRCALERRAEGLETGCNRCRCKGQHFGCAGCFHYFVIGDCHEVLLG